MLEKIPATLAAEVASSLSIPVIGIGAGPNVDGQVLVLQDMLGMSGTFHPKFLRTYANIGEQITKAAAQYVADVKQSDFPSLEESY